MFKILSLRQKILIGFAVVSGLFLALCSVFNLLCRDTLNYMIFFYGFAIPLFLLMSDALIDLNNRTVFGIWLIIAVFAFIISLITYGNNKFIIQRSSKFDNTPGINSFIAEYSTSSLKSLLIFLIFYWLLNKLLVKKGLFLINTFKKRKWYHAEAKRKITWIDVVINIVLFVIIFVAALFGK